MKNISKTFLHHKVIIIIITLSFFINFLNITLQVKNFNKKFYYTDGSSYHGLIRTPPETYIWKQAHYFKENFHLKNMQDSEFRYHFLPPKLLTIAAKIFKIEFYTDDEINTKNLEFFLVSQLLIYLLSNLYLYKKLTDIKIDKAVKYICISFLVFEPSINQFSSTIFGETIFLSLIIFLLASIINLSKNNYYYFFLGLLISLIYLQRSVAMLLIVFPALLIIIKYKYRSSFKLFNLAIVYLFFLIALGSINYQRSGIFYFFPTQTIDNLYNYFLPKLEERISKESSIEVNSRLKEYKLNYALEQKLDLSKESDRIKFYKFQKNYALNKILSNKLLVVEIAIKSSIHSMLLNPVEISFTRLQGREYYKSELHQNTIIFRIIYSFFIYTIILVGFIYSLKNHKINSHLFFFIGLYFFIVSSWVGYTRYFLPTFITLSLYFSYGANFIFTKLLNKYKKKYE